MIREWQLSNFKSVPWHPVTRLDLKPLNVLVGPNSSGKSTLLQSILMIAQTLRNSSGERPLILNGELVRLGHAKEVLHEGTEIQPLKLKFSLAPALNFLSGEADQDQRRFLDVETEFDLSDDENAGFDLKRAGFSSGEEEGILSQKALDQEKFSDLLQDENWHIDPTLRAQIEKGWFDHTALRLPRSLIGQESTYRISGLGALRLSYFHFLPKELLEPYDRDTELQANSLRLVADAIIDEKPKVLIDRVSIIRFNTREGRIVKDQLKKAISLLIDTYNKSPDKGRVDFRPPNTWQFLRTLTWDLDSVAHLGDWTQLVIQKLSPPTKRKLAKILREEAAKIEVAGHRGFGDTGTNAGLRTQNMPVEIAGAVQEVRNFFVERLRYLGPLRDDPRAIYGMPYNPETKDVGPKGEFTAAVLDRYKDEVVSYPSVPTDDFPSFKLRKRPLIIAVSEWLKYMDLVEEVATNDLGKIGYELKVRSKGVNRELDLTNVGVGVSQVLPTLVMALLAPEDSILLLEQPELHLHPKVQSRLGDFLIGISLTGRQCIIETHSEYLVNRVRRRVVQAEGDSLLTKIGIYFVEKAEGGTSFQKIEPNEYGAVLRWPKGFFDEGPAEANLILEAAMKKRLNAKK